MKQIWRITFIDGYTQDFTVTDFYSVWEEMTWWTVSKLQSMVSVKMIGEPMLRCEKEQRYCFPLALTHDFCNV